MLHCSAPDARRVRTGHAGPRRSRALDRAPTELGRLRWPALATARLCLVLVLSYVAVAVPAWVSAEGAPVARPPTEPAQPLARTLFEAIVHDDPARAEAFFFPRDAFVLVKAIARPERYYDKLLRRFRADIHTLHEQTPELAQARFERLELTRRGGYVAKGEEGNKLPYWAARHAFLHYRVGAQLRKLEVRVLISWQERWYVIHLREFH
jgi:hypothetical protein